MPSRLLRRPDRYLLPLVVVIGLACAMTAPPLHAGDAESQARVATVKTLDGPVNVERGGRTIGLSVGSALQQADTVVTGNASTIGLAFEDDALISLGPNSRLLIERFLQFDRGGGTGEFRTTLSRGRMAVVSGKIAKSQIDAMKVRTPAALLGVRGTEFLVDAGP